MATTTERFGFTLPAGSDPVLRAHINGNTNLTEQYIGATQDMIAPMYDDAATYDVGDICTYDSVLYKCITAIATAEPFDATKWTETTAVEEGSGGGGGSNVIPNPTGTPTDTLSTIGIDGTIYDIEGGGGSGAPYKEDELYTASSTSFANIPVDWNWNDYDIYVFRVGDTLPSAEKGITSILTRGQIQDIITSGIQQCFTGIANGGGSCNYYITNTEITTRNNTGNIVITSIVGIKLSGTYLAPVVYSTEEREIGVWTDGKPLYQKTLVGSWNLDGARWSSVITNIPNGELCKIECLDTDRQYMGVNGNISPSGDLTIFNLRSASLTSSMITVWYTKSTDTAGSGRYTPAGLPTARGIEYDNTDSGLDAENAQDAIDEVSLTLKNTQGYDEYDETQTYAVGDYAIYNNVVYECTTAVSTAEPFDSTKWSATSIEQIIDGVKGDVSQLNSSMIQYRMVQMNITTQTVNPQGGATLLNDVDFTTSTMLDTFSNKTLAQLFSGKTILGAHFMWTNGSGSASVSEYVNNNKVTIGVMNVSSVQLAYSAVRVAIWYR